MGNEEQQLNIPTSNIAGWSEPVFLDLNNDEDVGKFNEIINTGSAVNVADQVGSALEELFHIEYPDQIDSMDSQLFDEFMKKKVGENKAKYGIWVYFPWNKTLVHFPPAEDLRKLRGSRNRNLITNEEREKLINDKTIVILGLSVGSNVVDSLLMQGIGSRYILVDMDSLDPTNLNRIRASYDQIGVHKVDIVAKKISELDPYLEQIHYKDGLNEENLGEIIEKYKPDIIIDEMDSLKLKIVTRLRAKDAGIPVLMATDDGDDILLDIERYDLDNDGTILHGVMPEEVIQMILNSPKLSRPEMGAIIGKYFVNLENVPVRMLESLLEVGRTLPSWPQLGGAAVLSGLYISYAAKKIILSQPINSGRFLMGPEEQLNPELETEDYKARKTELIKIMTRSN